MAQEARRQTEEARGQEGTEGKVGRWASGSGGGGDASVLKRDRAGAQGR